MQCARTLMLVGVMLLVASDIVAQDKAAATGPGQDLRKAVEVRVFTSDSALVIVQDAAEEYQASHPGVKVTLSHGGGSIHACDKLATGEADLSVSDGAEDILRHRCLQKGRRKLALLKDHFKPGQLRVFPLARRVMAVAVHPQSGIDSMDDKTLKAILAFMVNPSNPDPLAYKHVRYVTDGYACNSEMARIVLNGDDNLSIRHAKVVHPVSQLLLNVAADKSLVALTRVDDALLSSGLNVLPIEVTPGQKAVSPTVANVLSGAYPYQTHLLAAVHPDAPPEAAEFARALQGAKVAARLAQNGWITATSKDKGAADEYVWPEERDHAAANGVRGDVAVLPTRLLTKAFLVGDTSIYAAYEDKVAQGIKCDGRGLLLDREQLARVLSESGIGNANHKPVIAADVLVLLQVTTEQAVTFLRVKAFHSATATLIGEMKLPLHPSKPATFNPSLDTRVLAWWPGVLRNLQLARTRTVWVVRPLGDRIESSRKQADAAATLLQNQEYVFVARYAGLADAQQEALMSLMGLARSQNAAQLPAADYFLDVQADANGRIDLCVRRGNDLQAIASKIFAAPGKDMDSWIQAQATLAMKQQRTRRNVASDDGQAAGRQAREELQQAIVFHQRYTAMVAHLAKEYPGSSDTWPKEQWRELRALQAEELRAFERASQMDPSLEEALLGVARGRRQLYRDNWDNSNVLEHMLAAIRAQEQFLATFPRSANRADMLLDHTQCCYLASSSATAGLQAEDQRRLRVFFLHKAVESFREFVEHLGLDDGSTPRRYDVSWPFYHTILNQYLPLLGAKEADTFVQDWAKRYDRQDTRSLHSDFLRLILLGNRQDRSKYRRDRARYLALLRDMQKRWPDPKHFQWRQGGTAVSNTLWGLCNGNGSFAAWLNGERGIGDLPYPGFDPNQLTGQVRVVRIGPYAPIYWAAESFRSIHKDVNVWFQEPGRDDVGRFLRGEADLLYYVGTLKDEDTKRLRGLCGKGFPGTLLGHMPPPDPKRPGDVQRQAPPRDAVYVLVHPDAEEHTIALAQWLTTPAAQKVMATYFLSPPSGTSKAQDTSTTRQGRQAQGETR